MPRRERARLALLSISDATMASNPPWGLSPHEVSSLSDMLFSKMLRPHCWVSWPLSLSRAAYWHLAHCPGLPAPSATALARWRPVHWRPPLQGRMSRKRSTPAPAPPARFSAAAHAAPTAGEQRVSRSGGWRVLGYRDLGIFCWHSASARLKALEWCSCSAGHRFCGALRKAQPQRDTGSIAPERSAGPCKM